MAVLLHLPLLGWAKPVPIDIRQFRDPMRDFAITALAGPVSNLAQVMVYSIIFHVAMALGLAFLAIVVAAWITNGVEPAGTWEQFLDAIGIENKPRFTQLAILGVACVFVVTAARVLRSGKDDRP